MRYLALTLVLILAAAALSVISRRGGLVLSPIEVGWTRTGFRLAFTREPAGPGAVRLAAGSTVRTEATSSADGVHHALEVRGLLPGQPITATPLAGERVGPPVVLTSRGSALVDLTEKDASDGTLTVTFRTAVPARCKLQVQAASGLVWLEAEPAPLTDHALPIPPVHAPFLGAVAVEIATGDDVHVEPVVATPRLRTARRLRLADELSPRARRAMVAVKREYLAKKKGDAAPAAVLPPLPAWLADELGGPGGALDDTDLPPRRKDQMYRTLLHLGDYDRLRPAPKRLGWHLLPRARGFGVSAMPHFEKATHLPLVETERNLNEPVVLYNDWAIKFVTKAELSKAGNPKLLRDLAGSFELDRFESDTRVELFTRARIPKGRALQATINDVYVLRLNDPDKADGQIHDHYAAFDPAYLVTGWNRLVIEDDIAPEDPEPTATTVLEPPGVQILITP